MAERAGARCRFAWVSAAGRSRLTRRSPEDYAEYLLNRAGSHCFGFRPSNIRSRADNQHSSVRMDLGIGFVEVASMRCLADLGIDRHTLTRSLPFRGVKNACGY